MTRRSGFRPFPLLLTAAVLVPGYGSGAEKRAKPHEKIAIPPLRPFTQPKPQRHVLENGMVVFLLEDHALPVIDVSGLVRAGAVHDPAGKTGLADLCGEVIRSGGTADFPGDRLDAMLESAGASIGVSIGEEQASFSLGCLAEDFDRFLPVLVDVLRRPAFPEDKIRLARTQMLSNVARRNDDPDDIAGRLLPRMLYGADSPFARQTETWTIEAITREDLTGFHQRFFRPDGTILGITGDFDAAKTLARIREAFGGWPRGSAAPPVTPSVRPEPSRTVNLAKKPELNQATVIVGHYGTVRKADDPDSFALVVMDEILGAGGFGTRLMQNVRTREGLAYGVWSRFGAEYTHPGIFQAGCQTKSGSAARAVESIMRQIRRMTEEPPTPEELRLSRESILNGMVFQFDTRGEIVQREMRYEYRGFPSDYMERFQKGVAAVTAADVQRVARKYLRPDNLSVLVIGNPEAFDKPLSSLGLGPVTEIPLVTAPPESVSGKPAPEALAAGRKLMEKAAQAMGGVPLLDGIKTLRIQGTMTAEAAPGMTIKPLNVTMTVAYPDRIRIDITTPLGAMAQGFDGKAGWTLLPGGAVQDLPESQSASLKDRIRDAETRLVSAAASGKLDAWTDGETALADGPADEVRIRTEGGTVQRLFIDRATRRLVKTIETGPQGTTETLFSEHKPVNGLLFSFRQKTVQAGGPAQEMTLESVTVNPDVADALFAKPSGK